MSSEAEWGVGGVLKGRAQGCGSGLDEAMLVRINNGPRPVPAFSISRSAGAKNSSSYDSILRVFTITSRASSDY